MSPLPTRDSGPVRHPGQVRRRRTRALLNFPEGTLFYRASRDPDNVPAKVGNQRPNSVIDLHWIPDLARLGGLVRNDGFGEL
jgi:hypothetical protein